MTHVSELITASSSNFHRTRIFLSAKKATMFYQSPKNDLCQICDDAVCKDACTGILKDSVIYRKNIFKILFSLAKTAALLAANDEGDDVPVLSKSSASRSVATSFVLGLVLAKSFF